MTDSPSVNLNIEGDGLQGKAVTWLCIVCLIAGLGVGIWITTSFLRFEPSQEYQDTMANLRVTVKAIGDSLNIAQEDIDETDNLIVSLANQANIVNNKLDNARLNANNARSISDSLRAALFDPEQDDVSLLIAENESLRESLSARDRECELCGIALAQKDTIAIAQQFAIINRDRILSLYKVENHSFSEAIYMANAEISRAAGKIPRWYIPNISIGVGVTIPLFGEGIAFGPSITIGFSFSPF